MIIIAGHNQFGNVLHLIAGPETEFFMDIHGAKITEVTAALQAFNADERVFMSFTRCKNENVTRHSLDASGITYQSSFSEAAAEESEPGQPESTSAMPEQPQPQQAKPGSGHKCTYCGNMKVLMAIPGFEICKECAQIELGLNQTARKQSNDDC